MESFCKVFSYDITIIYSCTICTMCYLNVQILENVVSWQFVLTNIQYLSVLV